MLSAGPVHTRSCSEFRNSQSRYYITLSDGERTLGTIFTASSDMSEELLLAKAGNKVELSNGIVIPVQGGF